MTVPSPTLTPEPEDTGIRRHRWTRPEYHRAAELGLFDPEDRLELLDGEIWEKMPQSRQHIRTVRRVVRVLQSAFGPGFSVEQQSPVALADDSEPEPDVVVLPGSEEDYPDHPTPADVVLLVEVSDTTLNIDRNRKQATYARESVPEYWILNLRNRTLEIYRDPATLPGEQPGFAYRTRIIFTEQQTVAPLAQPQASLPVADLLPPPDISEKA